MAARAERLPEPPSADNEPDQLYAQVRALSEALVGQLSDADASAQPMPDASPAKWHLAHTSWFFETFVLRDHVPGYTLFDARWPFLFNSYYEAEGQRIARDRRGMLTRPSLEDVLAYRAHVDAALAEALPGLPADIQALVTLGLHHEQQHQELLLTDMLALLAENPLAPAMFGYSAATLPGDEPPPPLRWIEGTEGVVEIGHPGGGFGFDCEGPRHRALLHPHALADRLVTNGEWRAFVEDRGYATPSLWLADGWAWARANAIVAPLYWREEGERFGLDGLAPLDPAAPVAHVSFFEADAYARWAGARLPSEAEWESAAAAHDPAGGNQLDGAYAPAPRPAAAARGLRQMFGDVWQWTASAYLPYPGFQPAAGAVGEYNGKFMSGQCVLRGASCATPRGHSRASYRNFFYPHQRWQFTGVRLARDL